MIFICSLHIHQTESICEPLSICDTVDTTTGWQFPLKSKLLIHHIVRVVEPVVHLKLPANDWCFTALRELPSPYVRRGIVFCEDSQLGCCETGIPGNQPCFYGNKSHFQETWVGQRGREECFGIQRKSEKQEACYCTGHITMQPPEIAMLSFDRHFQQSINLTNTCRSVSEHEIIYN